MKPTILRAESKDGFKFTFQIEKSLVKTEDNDLILSGVASTTNVDHDNERMDENALKRMVNIVNSQGVPLRWEHSKDPSAVLGTVFKGHVDERGNMNISARLDSKHPMAKQLYDAIKGGERYGLSVGGKILNAVKEMSESAGKYVKTFYDVLLDEVSVTKKPANYDAWLTTALSKSRGDKTYSRFLFENQQFDYMAQIAKSIPIEAWKKVRKLEINNNKKTMKDEKEKVGEENAEKSFVTKAQFERFSSDVTKAISGLTGLLKAGVDVGAVDTTNPDKSKEEVDTQQTAKSDADGDNGKSASDVPAKDQENPDKSTEQVETQQTAKEQEGEKEDAEKAEDEDGKDKNPFAEKAVDEAETEEGEVKEKAEDDMKEDAEKAEGDEKDEDAEKAEDSKDSKLPKDLKVAMKSIGDAIGVIENLTKKMSGIKKIAKSQKIAKSSVSDIDRFAVAMAGYVDSIEERLSKSQKSLPGYREAFIDRIRQDSDLQAEIRKMMKEPGAKKSVAFGNAYMVTKDGKRYSLTASNVEEKVEKSQYNKDKAVDFKTLYKSQFSAIREAGAKE